MRRSLPGFTQGVLEAAGNPMRNILVKASVIPMLPTTNVPNLHHFIAPTERRIR
jgi:hypothetical protein